LSGEKKRLDDLTDGIGPNERKNVFHLVSLRADLEKLYNQSVLNIVLVLKKFNMQYSFKGTGWILPVSLWNSIKKVEPSQTGQKSIT
jgi:hypothetical protein